MGTKQDKLVTFYILKIRSILMFGAVCFHSSLSKELSERLELQQKRSLAVILGYQSYQKSLTTLILPRLDTLREEVCLNWALKTQNNPKHSDLFPLKQSIKDTRSQSSLPNFNFAALEHTVTRKKKFLEYNCHTSKYYKSTIPYMTILLNMENDRNHQS